MSKEATIGDLCHVIDKPLLQKLECLKKALEFVDMGVITVPRDAQTQVSLCTQAVAVDVRLFSLNGEPKKPLPTVTLTGTPGSFLVDKTPNEGGNISLLWIALLQRPE